MIKYRIGIIKPMSKDKIYNSYYKTNEQWQNSYYKTNDQWQNIE